MRTVYIGNELFILRIMWRVMLVVDFALFVISRILYIVNSVWLRSFWAAARSLL